MQIEILKKLHKNWLILPGIALLTFLLTLGFTQLPEWAESAYSQSIYPVVATILSMGSNLFPFSLDDLFYFILIAGFLLLLGLTVFRKITLIKAGKILINGLAFVYFAFYFLWGFNYYRPGLNTRTELKASNPDSEDFIRVVNLLIERVNTNYCSFTDFDFDEADSLIEAGYQRFSGPLKLDFPNGRRRPKAITLSHFFAKAGISGYYGPFFNEIHMNRHLLPIEYPFVLAHEKAHQFGITNEAEANFHAWLVCSRSTSEKLRYSAYIQALRSFLYQGQLAGMSPGALSKLDERVKADIRTIYDHWKKLRNDNVDKVASKVYDTYLKTNKVEMGIEDYNGVVKFIMDFSNDPVFRGKMGLD